jgi:hypothetical protein
MDPHVQAIFKKLAHRRAPTVDIVTGRIPVKPGRPRTVRPRLMGILCGQTDPRLQKYLAFAEESGLPGILNGVLAPKTWREIDCALKDPLFRTPWVLVSTGYEDEALCFASEDDPIAPADLLQCFEGRGSLACGRPGVDLVFFNCCHSAALARVLLLQCGVPNIVFWPYAVDVRVCGMMVRGRASVRVCVCACLPVEP